MREEEEEEEEEEVQDEEEEVQDEVREPGDVPRGLDEEVHCIFIMSLLCLVFIFQHAS
jgi:hypothetical protein